MRRWISFGVAVLTSAVVVIGAPSGTQAVGPCANTSAAVFGGGNGSASTPYLISSTAHLVALSDDANSDTWGCHFTQTANIDLSSVSDWQPIGNRNDSENVPFRGSYDGGGFTVSNLNITVAGITIAPSTYQYNAGLFGLVRYATLKNITIAGARANTTFIDNANNGDYTTTSSKTALLAGTIESSLVSDITISGGEITLTPDTDHGGIAALAETSMFESLRVDGLRMTQNALSASQGTRNVGAIIGLDDGNDLVANVSVSNVEIDAKTPLRCTYIGGVTGRVNALTNYEDVNADVNITLDCDQGVEFVGGVVGEYDADGARFHRAAVKSSIVATSISDLVNIGGIFGRMDGEGSELSNVTAETNLTLSGNRNVFIIGGAIGRALEAVVLRDLNVASSIITETVDGGNRTIGGLVGDQEDGVVSDISVISTLDLKHRAQSGLGETDQILEIGGVFGDADDTVVQNLRVSTTIGIDTSQAQEPAQVFRVGGVIGDSDSDTSFNSVFSEAAITVNSSEAAYEIGGVVGYFSGSRTTTSTVSSHRFIDSTSTISVASANASSNSTCGGTCNVGGFSGDAYPSLTDSVITAAITASSAGITKHIGGLSALRDTTADGAHRPQLFKRVVVRSAVPTVPQSAAATTSHLVGADVSYFEGLNVPLTVSEGVLFDSTIAGTTSAGDGQPGTAATAAQLATLAFLTSQGYDTDKVWCVVGGRPGIRDVTPGCATATGSLAGTIRARVRVPITPQVVALSSGTSTTFTVSPALPAGVVLNASTGMLSGTPRAILAPTMFTVTATTGDKTSASTFTLQVGKRPKFLAEVADRARGVVFTQNSTKLTASAKRSLRKMLPRLRNAERVVIQGHVSARESQSLLQARRLSYRRAMVVKRYLQRRGVTVDVVTGYNIRRPSRVNDTRTPRATVFWLNP